MSKPASLPYYGGKAKRRGQWIASLLPWEKQTCYVEPFSGMFSVLLSREPVKYEIINDLNDRVVNWARAVRDYPQEFGYMVEQTLHSQSEFKWALENMDNPELSDLKRALAFHIVISQSLQKGDNASPGNFRRVFAVSTGSLGRWRANRVDLLSQRLFNVQILCEDALKLLERLVDKKHVVVYCDPPYPTANTTAYRYGDLDKSGLADVLIRQQGRVAISGYGDEWDGLGWERHEMETQFAGIGQHASNSAESRTEVLWTNYKPETQLEVI